MVANASKGDTPSHFSAGEEPGYEATRSPLFPCTPTWQHFPSCSPRWWLSNKDPYSTCTHSPSYCWTSPVCFSLISPPPSALPHTSHEYVCDQARSEPLMRRITCLELVSFPDLPSVRYWEFHWGPGNETRMTLAIHWALLPGLCPRAHSLLPDSCLCGSLTLRFSWSSFFFKSANHHLNLLTEVMWQLCNIMWDHVMDGHVTLCDGHVTLCDGHVTLCDGHVTHETWNKVHVLHVGLTLSLSSLKASRSSRSLVIIAAAYIIAVNAHVK